MLFEQELIRMIEAAIATVTTQQYNKLFRLKIILSEKINHSGVYTNPEFERIS